MRKELAAAQDYEGLSLRAAEVRKGLAEAPIVATSDPLPAAFSATLGRVLPVEGTEGVALLLTAVVEILSCCGLAGLQALYDVRHQDRESGSPIEGSLGGPGSRAAEGEGGSRVKVPQSLPGTQARTLPKPSLSAVASGLAKPPARSSKTSANPPSNVLPIRPRSSLTNLPEGASPVRQGGSSKEVGHVLDFVQERLQRTPGASLAASEV